MSRVSIPFKSLFGVLEDMEVPEKAENGVRGLGEPLGEATKKKSKKTSQQVWTISKNGEPPPQKKTTP